MYMMMMMYIFRKETKKKRRNWKTVSNIFEQSTPHHPNLKRKNVKRIRMDVMSNQESYKKYFSSSFRIKKSTVKKTQFLSADQRIIFVVIQSQYSVQEKNMAWLQPLNLLTVKWKKEKKNSRIYSEVLFFFVSSSASTCYTKFLPDLFQIFFLLFFRFFFIDIQ